MAAYAAVCSAFLALQVPVARATLPASVGTGAAVPGDPAPSFNIPLLPEEPGMSKAPMNLVVFVGLWAYTTTTYLELLCVLQEAQTLP